MEKPCCEDFQVGASLSTSEKSKGDPRSNPSPDRTGGIWPIRPVATETAKQLLSMALATLGWRERANLAPAEEAVRRYILGQFPLWGRAPRRQELMMALGLSLSETQRILDRLHVLDLLYLKPGTREVHTAYPFSTVPTRHMVQFPTWAETKPVYAPCAVDALGIPFMLRRDVSIVSSCAHCARQIILEVRNQAITNYQPTETAVWAGTTRSGHAATSICPTINFFCSFVHVSAWLQSQPEAVGRLLNLGEALYLGKGIFGHLLEEKLATNPSSTATPRSALSGQTFTATTLVGGLVAALLASVCCIVPLVLAILGVGLGTTGLLASTAGFVKVLLPYRPWFIGLTAGLLGMAFYLAYRNPRVACAIGTACAPVSNAGKTRAVLWLVMAAAIALILAPYWLGL